MNRPPLLYGLAINNTPERINEEDLQHFAAAEVQLAMWHTRQNGAGDLFTPDGTPVAQWLHDRGVDMWVYVDTQWRDHDQIAGTPGPPETDPYFWWVESVKFVDPEHWLYCNDGSLSDHYWHGMSPINVTDPAWQDWAVERLWELVKNLPVKQLRWDNAFLLDFEMYVYCETPITWQQWTEGIITIFDRLRERGVKIIANMAWAMSNPESPPDQWIFPYMDHVDGVMMERGSGQSLPPNNRILRWWNRIAKKRGWRQYRRWWSSEPQRHEIARRWLDAGKVFLYAATLYDEEIPDWPDFESFARQMWAEAQMTGYDVLINPRHENYGNTPWFDWYPDQKPNTLLPSDGEPDPDPDCPPCPDPDPCPDCPPCPDPGDIVERVDVLESDMMNMKPRVDGLEDWHERMKDAMD